ncbi:hypothetical protein J7E93_11095 [Streptomyces sp. ISL-36]|uniref:hypothetical protein n=1 Tax=Streptomyces sp. ISL-36 TaxID=2819182 RepID=UPI001BEA1232|nr:hypothetical protein [Streptomyces sp. ISL-36]MBT2440647.1 hypothetical protein [Streptomyces sp. ISL-36]
MAATDTSGTDTSGNDTPDTAAPGASVIVKGLASETQTRIGIAEPVCDSADAEVAKATEPEGTSRPAWSAPGPEGVAPSQ